jgi:tRNA nucleotidyltransferase/poly(A) polymerase
MTPEPRYEGDYGDRQVEAAHRVLVDVGQVLQSFREAIVLVGGWVPDLLLPDAEPAHVGSIDVDLALDVGKLGDGRYADLLKLLLDTRRYRPGEKDFQLVTDVDLGDREAPIRVEVEFMAPATVRLKKKARTRRHAPVTAEDALPPQATRRLSAVSSATPVGG